MVQDAHVAGYDFVLENGAGRDIDTITVIGNNDDSSLWEEMIGISRVQDVESISLTLFNLRAAKHHVRRSHLH